MQRLEVEEHGYFVCKRHCKAAKGAADNMRIAILTVRGIISSDRRHADTANFGYNNYSRHLSELTGLKSLDTAVAIFLCWKFKHVAVCMYFHSPF